MIPSRGLRGLRPAYFAQSAANSSSLARANASRQFSSFRRTSALPTSSNRINALQSVTWRAGALPRLNQASSAQSLRYASWWGNSTPIAPYPESRQAGEALKDQAVTTATPELAPSGIDKAAVVDGSSASASPDSVEGLIDGLLQDPAPVEHAPIDPNIVIDHVGMLKELGLDYGWGVTSFFEWLIEHVYIYTGYGWGSSIVLSALAIRFVGFFFLQTRASHNQAKIAAVQPLTKDLFIEMREAMQNGDQTKQLVLQKKQKAIYQAVGASPIAGMLPLALQGAFGFGAFRCLRGMTELPVPGMEQGGFLWFENLAVSDPYCVLPVATGVVMHLLMKKGGETGAQDQTAQAGALIVMTYFMPVAFTAITLWQPAALQIYFMVTTLTGVVSAQLLRTPSIRNALRLAPLPTKESREFWTKVAEGKIPLQNVSQAMASPTYQPPRATSKPTRSDIIEVRGMRVKKSTLPDHLKPAETKVDKNLPTSDKDFDAGPPQDSVSGKIGWFMRNYRPHFVWNRFKRFISSYTDKEVGMKVAQRRKEIAKRKAEEFEARRRERMRK